MSEPTDCLCGSECHLDCDEAECLCPHHTSATAEPVIEVAPGEYERCAVPAQVAPRDEPYHCPSCAYTAKDAAIHGDHYLCERKTGHPDPRKVATADAEPGDIRWIETPEGNLKPTLQAGALAAMDKVIEECGFEVGILKSGAQVPSQDAEIIALRERLRDAWVDATGDNDFDWFLIAALQHIRNYTVEAAKTPITRESILAAPQVAEQKFEKYIAALEKSYPDLPLAAYVAKEVRDLYKAALEAGTQTGLTQFDEMQGLRRLILSESGGGK